MGGASKGVSICSTLILMILTLQIWTRLTNILEYQTQQLLGQFFAFLQGSSTLNEPTLVTIIIIILGVVSIIGAAKG
jgi:hypothetical protein